MNLINSTITWYKGEIFEASVIGIIGLLVVFTSLAFLIFGNTPYSKALIIPLLTIGLLLGVAGYFMATSNTRILDNLENTIIENPQEFVKNEKDRVESFQPLYFYTKVGASITFLIALCLFFFSENRYAQSIAIALIILGLSGLTIDYFSKERASIYYSAILKNIV